MADEGTECNRETALQGPRAEILGVGGARAAPVAGGGDPMVVGLRVPSKVSGFTPSLLRRGNSSGGHFRGAWIGEATERSRWTG